MTGAIVVLGAAVVAFSSLPGVAAGKNKKEDGGAQCTTDEKTGKKVCGTQSVPGTLPKSAKIAIAVVTIAVVFLILLLIFYIRRSRKASADAANEVAVEASQVEGPPAILAATYTPETGHSRVYSIGPDSGGFSAVPVTPAPKVVAPLPTGSESHGNPWGAPRTPAQPVVEPEQERPKTPAFPPPSPAVLSRSNSFCRFPTTPTRSSSVPQTAPAHKAGFSEGGGYPFTGFGSSNNSNGAGSNSGSGNPPRTAFVSNGGFPRPLLAGRLKDRIRERPPSVSSISIHSPK
ncbi:hypothetical protein CC1G_02711 [Coprinopsis cinerea okayama7|uniref:Transmembrane protein n=1 Tax=Coprinopsis cinerea (strain Okayama-7 / 130 / ATCC MYA-4618 / FGSC 9003) TaxID=240176 RepID=A8PBR1_COPC7|nr:hypothetical protein CC1G_02711 [Coprinopsis cinerea okayama7\|eukprot:XP_001840248.2 hypothetical protein CC1G_02711 [Coprinopsis cinerea okayama7\